MPAGSAAGTAGTKKTPRMPERPSAEYPVVIVGGGWAGLAAAVELCTHKVPVTLLESARQLGGRARSIRAGDMVVDNGQHLIIGAYQSLLSLMERVAIDHRQVFLRLPMTLRLFKEGKPSLRLKAPPLPAPWHLLAAIACAHGLSPGDRIQALRFGRKLATLKIGKAEDISVQALLHSETQSPAIIRKLWEPLCIATLNTPVGEASARIFLRVLRETFLGLRKHSDFLIPKRELGDLLPRPCADYLERNQARVEMGQRVTSLSINNDGVHAVSVRGRSIAASHVVLATPHVISRRLMSRHEPLHALSAQLAGLGNEPITTLYLQYPPQTRLPEPVLGFESGLSQWVFDRRVCSQPGMMAVVISARGDHENIPDDELTKRVAAELATSFPDWPVHQHSLIIREKRATFCSRAGIDRIRPENRTPVSGLWLAGDYTATGLPATLESAVRSGVKTAHAILASRA
ncbi:MAG: hydroxysqualene dehydroxylase HpnE [Gammaproteobacteria bacterium]|nr:MAG: hydroxysqualene dehydroxylase HpnE [Gammaproteobacteria bacterium]